MAWNGIINKHLPFAAELDGEERIRWLRDLKVFAWEKNFEGLGLDVTDEMRVVISGCAARLSRNIGLGVFDDLSSVLLCPSTIALPCAEVDAHVRHDSVEPVQGVHFSRGAVLLAWDAVLEGVQDPHDGHDVALHELAHVIDAADGAYDGTPPLRGAAEVRAWADVFAESFLRLRAEADEPTSSAGAHPLHADAAIDEAEFFAVATEMFFECPHALRQHEPQLYAELCKYFGLEPLTERDVEAPQ